MIVRVEPSLTAKQHDNDAQQTQRKHVECVLLCVCCAGMMCRLWNRLSVSFFFQVQSRAIFQKSVLEPRKRPKSDTTCKTKHHLSSKITRRYQCCCRCSGFQVYWWILWRCLWRSLHCWCSILNRK